jgi:hypothetical protein
MKKRRAKRRVAMAEKQGSSAKAKISDNLTEEELENIRQRAYELYEARGRENGHEVEDWLQAEAEVGTKRKQS